MRSREGLPTLMRPRSVSSILPSISSVVQIGDFRHGSAGPRLVADFERLGVNPALREIGQIHDDSVRGRGKIHLAQAILGQVDVGFRMIAEPRKRGGLGVVRGGVQMRGGRFHFQILFGQPQIDFVFLPLYRANNLLLRSLQPGFLTW